MDDRVSRGRLAKYFALTESALKAVRLAPIDCARAAAAGDFLDMAARYHADARHFEARGDLVTAFAAVTYAHAWLDAGARIGLFKVSDSRLFAVDGNPGRAGGSAGRTASSGGGRR